MVIGISKKMGPLALENNMKVGRIYTIGFTSKQEFPSGSDSTYTTFVLEKNEDKDYLQKNKTKEKKKNNAEASSPSTLSESEVVVAEEERISFHIEEKYQQQYFLTKKEATLIVPNDDDNINDNHQNQNNNYDKFSLLPLLPWALLSIFLFFESDGL